MYNKLKLSGNLLEICRYSYPPKKHNRYGGRIAQANKQQSTYKVHEEVAKENKRCSLANTKRKFKRLVYANFYIGFTLLTLTFDAKCLFDTTDVVVCLKKFNQYWANLKRCKALTNIDLSYIGVIEFQENDTIHFHVLSHIPVEYKDMLKKKWKHGFVDVAPSKEDPLSIRKIANYLKKGIHDERLSLGKHRYLYSKGLIKPINIECPDTEIDDYLLAHNSELVNAYDSQYGFTYYEYITPLSPDDITDFANRADQQILLNMFEKLQTIGSDLTGNQLHFLNNRKEDTYYEHTY